MTRSLLILAILACGAPAFALESFEQAWDDSRSQRPVNLFANTATGTASALPLERMVFAQDTAETKPPTEEQFGAGASLGINYAAIGAGIGLWFEYYPMPFVAINAHTTFAYGVLGNPYIDGGSGFAFSFQLGGKFVLDFEDLPFTRWLRPFVAFYPVGVAYFSGEEEFDVPNSGDTDDLTYSDAFYLMSGGFGSDFYITQNIGVGAAVYIYGTVGGSRHEKRGRDLRTEGSVGVYFEYARLAIRF